MAAASKKSKKDGPTVIFRVSATQKKSVKQLAKKLGMTQSDFAKAKIFDGLDPEELQDKVLVDFLNQLRQLHFSVTKLQLMASPSDKERQPVAADLKEVFRKLCEEIARRQ